MKTVILGVALMAGLPALAQTGEVLEDFKPSSLNQPGQQYPQFNSQRYARFRIDTNAIGRQRFYQVMQVN